MIETNLIEDLRQLSPPDLRWLAWMAGVLMLGLAGLGGWRWWQGRTRVAGAVSAAGEAPWQVALAGLERLAGLLTPEASREYGIAATAVLRCYIETRYGLQAPRLATEEFLLVAAGSEALPPAHRASLGHFLEWCDLFKFGRFTGTPAELGSLHAAAVAFVLASRREDRSGPEDPAS